MWCIHKGFYSEQTEQKGGRIMKSLRRLAVALGVLAMVSVLVPLQVAAESYIDSVTITPATQTITRPATSINYALEMVVGGNGNGYAELSVTGLPVGISWGLNTPLPNPFKPSDSPLNRVLNLTVPSSVVGGTYGFQVSAISNIGTSNATTRTVSGALTITKGNQTLSAITFSPTELNVNGPTSSTASATSTSGLAVVFSSLTPSICTVSSSGNVNAEKFGTCNVAANQAGDANYNAAAQVTNAIAVVDKTAPTLNLSMLSSGAVTNIVMLNIAGVASDTSGIDSIEVNGVGIAHANGSFSVAIPLVDGDNIFTIIAKDKAGNSTSSGQRLIKLDLSSPALRVSAPADNSTIATVNSLIDVTGTIESGSNVELIVNGDTQGASITGGNFIAQVNLLDGMNTIEVIATDLGGKKSHVKRTVRYDPQGLSLQVVIPREDALFMYAENTVYGTIADFSDSVVVTVEINGQTYTPEVNAGAFQQKFTLPDIEALYAFSVTATDSLGRTSSVQRNLYKIDVATLSANPALSQIQKGVTVTFTAGANRDDGSYEYMYLINANTGGANIVTRPYDSLNTWLWDTQFLAENKYTVTALVRDAVTKSYVARVSMNLIVTSPTAATSATLKTSQPSPLQKPLPGQAGLQPLVFTASATSSALVEYKFTLLLRPELFATVVQDWSINNTWAWQTWDSIYPPGNYVITVVARNVGSAAPYETFRSFGHTLVTDAPVSRVWPKASQTSPKTKGGAPVVFTSSAPSSVPVEYQYALRMGTVTTVVRDWSTDNSWEWDTGGSNYPPGSYRVYVYARNVGSVATYEIFNYMDYILIN